MSKVFYTCALISEQDRQMLKTFLGGNTLYDDEIIHHMTYTLGELKPEERKRFLGREVTLDVIAHAYNDKVEAFGVSMRGEHPTCKNEQPHITISVNRQNGGKPFHSNELTDWVPLPHIITIKCKVFEVKK
jgi:hypothetical protein